MIPSPLTKDAFRDMGGVRMTEEVRLLAAVRLAEQLSWCTQCTCTRPYCKNPASHAWKTHITLGQLREAFPVAFEEKGESNRGNKMTWEEDSPRLRNVTRFEVIDSSGRVYSKWDVEELTLSFQDNNRTLKVFVKEKVVRE